MIKFIKEENVELPEYQSSGAAGFDVVAYDILKVYKGAVNADEDKLKRIKKGFKERGVINLRPHERILFSTGLTLAEIPENCELQVRSRSGLSLKKGLMVANQPGTIDSDYRGVIGVIIYNSTPFLAEIKKGERIAQLVMNQIYKQDIVEVHEISNTTERGDSGFGSTGEI